MGGTTGKHTRPFLGMSVFFCFLRHKEISDDKDMSDFDRLTERKAKAESFPAQQNHLPPWSCTGEPVPQQCDKTD
ncbi:hypothetical protein M3221_16180 [Domibacillus indicus]|uniref:hypothetical protein n=1 Tax=Domibacillus indicus TaxID=1437523 RepID=UPI00203E88EB|nr:hypothetical protein [Domibacillus indicus]MCM3789930.1 hypothetical protein [Domibacillus indicus]